MSKEEIYVLAYCEKCESNTRHEKTICTKCVKQETKQKAKAIVDKYSIKLIVKTIGYVDFENASIQCAILEVQSKIDLLEEFKKEIHVKRDWIENYYKTKLNQQKEILKYLEEL
jgi:hypothetical protein